MLTRIESDLDYISAFDPKMWQMLKDKKIFSTGCTGFIGAWINQSFLYINKKYNLNSELVCLTRNKAINEQKFPGIKFIEGDIKAFDFPEGIFDFVIHGATDVTSYLQESKSVQMQDNSRIGTSRIIEFSKKASVTKILFLSSGAAYGKQPLDMPLMAESNSFSSNLKSNKDAYGAAKREAEKLLFNDIIPATSARIFTVCGPFLPFESQFALSNFIRSVMKDEKIVINGNGKNTRSFLYAADLTLWLWTLLLKGRNKEIYNVGSEDEISMYDLANKIFAVLKTNNKIEVLGTEEHFDRYIPSVEKIRKEFNLTSFYTLEYGIQKSFQYFKDCYGI